MGEVGTGPGSPSGATSAFLLRPVPKEEALELGTLIIIHGTLFSVAMFLCILISVLI